jgi:hypothetical protein
MASRKVFVNIVLCILVLATIKLSAQDSTNFFPHHIGDMWEYYFTDFIDDDTVQVFVIADTLDSLGSHHVTQAARAINPVVPHTYHFPDTGEYILDTLGQVFSIAHGGLLYKLHANRNDIWIVRLLGGTMYEIAKVKNVSQDTLFSVPIITKEIWYYFTEDTTDTTIWLHIGTDIIADKFGLIFRGDPESGAFSILKGAVINGMHYGDTTLVSIHPTLPYSIPEQFHLYQNYPNPFNPRTTIPFQLNRSGRISIMIYDVTGKLVRKLIDNQWYPIGEHEIIWDGKTRKGGDAASGMYFYQLIVGQQRVTRPMLLIR